MPGCFPHKEGGHPGMYGDKNAGACAPGHLIEFLKKLYDEVGQSRIFFRDWITQAYEDNRGEHHVLNKLFLNIIVDRSIRCHNFHAKFKCI